MASLLSIFAVINLEPQFSPSTRKEAALELWYQTKDITQFAWLRVSAHAGLLQTKKGKLMAVKHPSLLWFLFIHIYWSADHSLSGCFWLITRENQLGQYMQLWGLKAVRPDAKWIHDTKIWKRSDQNSSHWLWEKFTTDTMENKLMKWFWQDTLKDLDTPPPTGKRLRGTSPLQKLAPHLKRQSISFLTSSITDLPYFTIHCL